ncbi:hypothetical protein BDR04DRAFT_1116230 [Suillus decipiens]|nr:hypothetical protein BDR04DRAFT_1116230 [Suillus decipiens]
MAGIHISADSTLLVALDLQKNHNLVSVNLRHAALRNSDATPRPLRRKPVITPATPISRPLPTRNPHAFLRFLRKLIPSSRIDAVRMDEPSNPLDFTSTSPLPCPLPNSDGNSRSMPVPPTIQSSVANTSLTLTSRLHRPSASWLAQTDHASPVIVEVSLAPGKLRYAAAGAPSDDDGLIRDEDYVPPSPNAGQHDSGRFCSCFCF